MRANFRALFEDANGNLATSLTGQLLKPNCGGQARGSGANDNDVIFHALASYRYLSHKRALKFIVISLPQRLYGYFAPGLESIGSEPITVNS
ncbi:hypothetical protein MPC4_310021 [Methylocella tundrae]|uniref:Uncharacterized protein n=1 Tax=Methylocella tundrae TaxID=227605 RepID=A0A8B6M8E9_METTU|nr:hypothetical protein MPC1_60010 [Methylocella tundrae]VTZ51146.1 hypothetical protein MPC4_310021 [Methylocella tundrae]